MNTSMLVGAALTFLDALERNSKYREGPDAGQKCDGADALDSVATTGRHISPLSCCCEEFCRSGSSLRAHTISAIPITKLKVVKDFHAKKYDQHGDGQVRAIVLLSRRRSRRRRRKKTRPKTNAACNAARILVED